MKYFSNLLLFSALLLVSVCHGEIVELTDATFEHETQASTGMTTGSWFVFFKAQQCPHCERIYPEFEALSQDEELSENGIVFATVDVPSNRATATRFDIRGFPSFLYLHKGNMYPIKGKRNAETWKHLLTDGFDEKLKDTAMPIPPPLTGLDQFFKTLKAAGREFWDAASGNQGSEGYLIVALISISMLVMGGLLSLFFLPAKKTNTKKKKQ
jgi:thiol-disulfide isomerase/thioredoxin